VQEGVADYTRAERGLLQTRPGVTDFSSIVFADEGDILEDSQDPDADYDRIIRPWKSRLGLFYVQNRSLPVDLSLIALTAVSLLSRRRALDLLARLLDHLGAEPDLVAAARRQGAIPQGTIPS
jgi:lipopolysaccharide/colanic/teichoic acid biosynthesis glycosyltransferase